MVAIFSFLLMGSSLDSSLDTKPAFVRGGQEDEIVKCPRGGGGGAFRNVTFLAFAGC